MKNKKLRGFGLIAATVLAAGVPHAFAQESPVRAVPQDATRAEQWQRIQIRNVSANFMAYWLDGKHHNVFEPQQGVKPTWAIGKTDAEMNVMFSLPASVQAIAPVDPQNALWVLGTPAGVQQVVEKVTLLDRPLRQVEIEAQIVQISAADAKTLGVVPFRKEGKIEIGLASADIQAKIEALMAQKKAKIITAPRVTAINGAKASLFSSTTTTSIIGANNRGGIQVQPFADAVLAKGEPYGLSTTTSLGLTITPTFNLDDTIRLQMGPIRTLGVSLLSARVGDANANADSRTSSIDLDDMPTQPIALKENQTTVLQGLQWRWTPIESDSGNKLSNSNVIVLLTAHILRRAGDDEVRTAALPR